MGDKKINNLSEDLDESCMCQVVNKYKHTNNDVKQ